MVQQPKVLLVEDEPAQREVLAYNLEAEGFDVIQADNGEDALLLVDEDHPDMIILDWMMPKVSGIEVCRRLKMRPETRSIPVIMLSARAEEVDRVRGLETGADDYVIKPYSVAELMARLRAHLRRVRPSAVGVRLEWQDISLDPETHRVLRNVPRRWRAGHRCLGRTGWVTLQGHGRDEATIPCPRKNLPRPRANGRDGTGVCRARLAP